MAVTSLFISTTHFYLQLKLLVVDHLLVHEGFLDYFSTDVSRLQHFQLKKGWLGEDFSRKALIISMS